MYFVGTKVFLTSVEGVEVVFFFKWWSDKKIYVTCFFSWERGGKQQLFATPFSDSDCVVTVVYKMAEFILSVDAIIACLLLYMY